VTGGWAQTQQAVSSQTFVNSIGVNTHFANFLDPNSVWYSGNFPQLTKALTELGVRNIREGLIPTYATNPASPYTTELQQLGADGILANVIASPAQGSIASQISAVIALNTGTAVVVGSVEGPNESDIDSSFTYNNLKFPAATVAFQTDLYTAMKSSTNALIKKTTIIGPSEGGTYSPGSNPIGTGSLYAYCDLGCFHPYSYGGNPFSNRFAYDTITWYNGAAQCVSVATDPGENTAAFQTYQTPFYDGTSAAMARPMAATERGWFTGTSVESVSQTTFAKYIPRLFAEDFYDGIARTYSYELMDEGTDVTNQQDCYGLVNSDFTPKPAYKALQNLIALTSDSNANGFTPGSLGFSVQVNPPTGYQRAIALHYLLLEQSNGIFQLLLWNDISSSAVTDTAGNNLKGSARDIKPPVFPTTITFTTPILSATIYNITPAGSLVTTTGSFASNALTINVPDNLLVVNLTAAPPAPVITSTLAATGTAGSLFNYAITATNNPSSYGATGLPPGLSVDAGTGLISGTPTATGSFTTTVSAVNTGGTGTAEVAIISAPPPLPVISSALSATGTADFSFSYQITASNSPSSFGASGLPAGLGCNPSTGLISGTPVSTGSFAATINAINLGGTGTATLSVIVATPPVPVVSSAASATGTDAYGFSYQITATNNPTGFSASGLPPGVGLSA